MLFIIFFISLNLTANNCRNDYPDLYKSDKENMFLTASKLKQYCHANDNTACVCLDNYMRYCNEKCDKKDGIYCMIIATTFGHKDNRYLMYLEKSCDGNYSDGCYVYGSYFELNYIDSKNKNSKKEAIYYYNKACKLGYKNACKSLKNIR